jgi:uncharacterized cupin superfamily protein
VHLHTLGLDGVYVRNDPPCWPAYAGFLSPASSKNGHQLVNRSDRPARYLEISNRDPEDSAEYPDVDLAYRKGPDGGAIFTHKDGTPY